MRIPDILDTTFWLYRDRFLKFLLIALVVYVPCSLLMAFLLPLQALEAASKPEAAAQVKILTILPLIYGRLAIQIIFQSIGRAALTHNISAAYLGREQSAWESYKRTAPRLLGLLWTIFLSIVAATLGLCFLGIPTIFCLIWFYVLTPVIMLERTASIAALARSRELVQGNLGKTALLEVLVIILVFTLGLTLGGVIGLALFAFPLVRDIVQTLAGAILLPIGTAPAILLYYDLRIRKEGFDLQMLSSAIEQPAAT